MHSQAPNLNLDSRGHPFLLPWVRVLILIRDIRSTTWGYEAWPRIKPLLRRAPQMRRQVARGVVKLDGLVAADRSPATGTVV
jgi:hypothetical protein